MVLEEVLRSQVGGGSPGTSGGFESLGTLSPAERDAVSGPLADAFAHTFVWAVVFLVLAWIPALVLALRRRGPAQAPAAEGAVLVE